jgi:dephospho-CoA kinase
MLRVALTGGIATGKSYCLAQFAKLGAATIDADHLARQAVEANSPGLAEVVERFGAAILRPDGSLDRPALARLVFMDGAARADLEALIHPRVYRAIRDWAANLPAATRIAMADIPLLFETGHIHDFDTVVVCACSAAEQLRRLMVRDGLAEPDARARLAAQWPIEEKITRAQHVIRTDGSYADTDAQIEATYQALSAR